MPGMYLPMVRRGCNPTRYPRRRARPPRLPDPVVSPAAPLRRSITLRQWQHEALARHSCTIREANFLAVACPGAGKTTFALTAARHWLKGERLPLVVVAPTRHLKSPVGVRPPNGSDSTSSPTGTRRLGDIPSDMHGIVVTYAQVRLGGSHAVRR
jgi:hypothetical protein